MSRKSFVNIQKYGKINKKKKEQPNIKISKIWQNRNMPFTERNKLEKLTNKNLKRMLAS